MTIQTPSNKQTQTSTEAKDPGEMSFAEYEASRRSGSKPVESEPRSAPEAKALEQKPSPESDTEETEEADQVEDESESDGDEPKGEDESEKEKPKKKSGFQRRVEKLSAAKAAAQREAEYWKQQAQKVASADKTEGKAVDKPQADDAGKPKPEAFETHAEYVEALTDWKLEQRDKANKEESQKSQLETEQQRLLKAHYDREKSFSEKTTDYAELLDEVDHFSGASPALRELIVTSENGPELMYELAKNRAEYERINKLPPLAAARELGKIEFKLAAKSSAAAKPEAKKLTSAPKPIEPVGSAKTVVRKSIHDADLPFADYERLRREQMKRRHG